MNVRAPSCRRRATKDTSQLDCPERRQDGRQRKKRELAAPAGSVFAPLRDRVRERSLGHCTALGVSDSPEYISYRRREDGPVLRGFLQMENPQRTTKVNNNYPEVEAKASSTSARGRVSWP